MLSVTQFKSKLENFEDMHGFRKEYFYQMANAIREEVETNKINYVGILRMEKKTMFARVFFIILLYKKSYRMVLQMRSIKKWKKKKKKTTTNVLIFFQKIF